MKSITNAGPCFVREGATLFILFLFFTACSEQVPEQDLELNPVEIVTDVTVSKDINNDGELNILVIGTSNSIHYKSGAFASDKIATSLENILAQDASIKETIHVSFEDIYRNKLVTFGNGGGGVVYERYYDCHSLMQYYYWPDGRDERLEYIAGKGSVKWDYVVIGADPYIVAKIPGYYSLGVNKLLTTIAEGGAKPLLLMVWSKDESIATISHFSEYTYRTADGASIPVTTIPAAKAWEALPFLKKDTSNEHPTANGAYLVASSIYSQIFNKSATVSDYQYDDEIALTAFTIKTNELTESHYTGDRTFISPFKSCDINASSLSYNHTGTSSENGILNGLQWIVDKSDRLLSNTGTSPINFNYGRANTNFEAGKRYKINPADFDFSFGFPMQDNGNYGDISMLYGLDERMEESDNSTDLGTAFYMIRNSELPYARAIPVRTLFAQLKEAIPSQSAYSDNWHMHGHLNKAIGAYMYTVLTSDNVLGEEPTDKETDEWRTWVAHKIGYETAINLVYFKGLTPL